VVDTVADKHYYINQHGYYRRVERKVKQESKTGLAEVLVAARIFDPPPSPIGLFSPESWRPTTE
jgi:hypothetical protein